MQSFVSVQSWADIVVLVLALYGLVLLILKYTSGIGQPRQPRDLFLSVLLVVRNKQEIIEGIIRDLLAGPHISLSDGVVPFELVAVDNQSQDDTAEILERLGRRYNNLRFIRFPADASQERSPVEVGLFLCRSAMVLVVDLQGYADGRETVEEILYLVKKAPAHQGGDGARRYRVGR